ncbi:hypothetical protein ACO1O0_003256 [Amphichorda felina]
MAEEQKTVDIPKAEETPAPAVETPKEEAPAAEEPKTEEPAPAEDKPAEDKPAEETKAEEKEEVKPIEEGLLGHKAQGASFPKNFIPSKEFFFFGADAYEPKALAGYLKNEKAISTYHANVAWASETGKGLLFIGDKKAPTGIINLSDASEPETDGSHKFTLTSKGNKHSFKAASAADRDNWVAQLKLKIAEAKELVPTVTESETYKATLESFKPAPKKEEKTEEAPKEEAKPEEEAAKTEEAPKEEAAKEEDKAESPKPLKSKRASFFGFMNKKEEPKEAKEEPKADEAKPEEAEAAKPAEEAKASEEAKPEEETAKSEDKPAEEEKPVETPKDKASKRASFFGGILSKKEKKAVEAKSEATEAPKEGEAAPATESAPVIPPVEATTPLAVDVDNSAPAPAEAEAPAATNGETKKDVKEKRKSSLPFGIGKREKSPAPAEGEEKLSKSPFSKLRATIKGKGAAKAEDKPAEETPKEETKEAEATEEPKAEEPAKEAAVEEPTESKPEAVATTTPAVTAAA